MSKYCTLKDMTPGSVVELPKEFASHEAEKGLIMGLEYNEDKTHVDLREMVGWFEKSANPATEAAFRRVLE